MDHQDSLVQLFESLKQISVVTIILVNELVYVSNVNDVRNIVERNSVLFANITKNFELVSKNFTTVVAKINSVLNIFIAFNKGFFH